MPQDVVKNNNQPAVRGSFQLGVITSEAGSLTERAGKRKASLMKPLSSQGDCAHPGPCPLRNIIRGCTLGKQGVLRG